ncbi:MAG: GTP-binding protein [Clostridiales bacterium]|nr:GTP-binding protein [Clostridiales bacterium]
MNDLLKFITCGSVDDGKSTLIGHILYNAKLLFADQKEALVLDSKVGSTDGNIDYSLLLDGLTAEREQGITIDVAYRYFTTDKRSFIVADTPGHEQYTRNMAVGASFADLAIILVDASQGVLVQTKRHARICSLMGINYFIFAVNKMDLVSYDNAVFKRIEEQINTLSDELKLKNIKIIPVSATEGDNITEKSDNMPWYAGEPILNYLENVEIKNTDDEAGFYMPIQRVCRPNRTFRGFQGQVEAGTVNIGDEITALPSDEKALVKSITVGDKESKSAFEGQPVTITLSREIDVSRGSVLSKDSGIKNAWRFNATLLWMDDSQLEIGKEYFIKLGTRKITGSIKEIIYKTDINSGEKLEASYITKNEIAVCEIILDEKIPISEFKKHKTLGELIIIDRVSNMTASCGVVEEIKLDDDELCTIIEGNGLKAKTYLFDEFFYNEKTFSIDNYSLKNNNYGINDEVPLKGESYEYPRYFDILALDSCTAVQIRDAVVTNLIPIDDYFYSGLPIVNGKGFFINIHSNDELISFFDDAKAIDKQQLYEKWMKFETYRRIIFSAGNWVI